MSITMRVQARRGAPLIIFLALVALFISPIAESKSSVPVRGSAEILQYRGTARTTIRYLDAFGRVLGQRTYQNRVTVQIGPPLRSGRMVESNPIHLSLAPIGSPSAEGQISIYSARPFNDSRDGLLQYWNLALSDGNLSGRLGSTHEAEAAAANLLNASKEIVPGRPDMGTLVSPYAISRNSKLAGTFKRNEIRLRIQGNESAGTRPFLSDIVATR